MSAPASQSWRPQFFGIGADDAGQSRVLVAFPQSGGGGDCWFIRGRLQVEVVRGRIECCGWTIRVGEEPAQIYSPRGHSLMSIWPFPSDDDRCEEGSSHGVRLPETCDCAAVFTRLDPDWCVALESIYLPHANVGPLFDDAGATAASATASEMENVLGVGMMRPENASGMRLFKEGSTWDTAVRSAAITRERGGDCGDWGCLV